MKNTTKIFSGHIGKSSMALFSIYREYLTDGVVAYAEILFSIPAPAWLWNLGCHWFNWGIPTPAPFKYCNPTHPRQHFWLEHGDTCNHCGKTIAGKTLTK